MTVYVPTEISFSSDQKMSLIVFDFLIKNTSQSITCT